MPYWLLRRQGALGPARVNAEFSVEQGGSSRIVVYQSSHVESQGLSRFCATNCRLKMYFAIMYSLSTDSQIAYFSSNEGRFLKLDARFESSFSAISDLHFVFLSNNIEFKSKFVALFPRPILSTKQHHEVLSFDNYSRVSTDRFWMAT